MAYIPIDGAGNFATVGLDEITTATQCLHWIGFRDIQNANPDRKK